MNKTQEALRMAIACLEEIHAGNMTPMAEINWNKAIQACKEALAELEQTKQLGVVYNGNAYWVGEAPDNGTSLYTSPQPREWAGLSDMQITNIGMQHQSLHQVAYAISDALKQLNTKG